MSARSRIFIPLLDDSFALQDVEAVPAGEGRFRIAGKTPAGKDARFKRGEIVECEIRALPDGSKALVAVRSISADPEFRKRRNVYAIFGAVVGGFLGAAFALSFDMTAAAAAAGLAIGAGVFAYCSVRWGDSAWTALIHLLDD